MPVLEFPEEWGRKLEQGLYELRERLDETREDGGTEDTPSGIWWCGECSTCDDRETIYYVVLEALKASAAGTVRLVDDE